MVSRCVLVIPPWVPEDIFSSKVGGSQVNYWQPLGTLYVAAVLQREGREVRLFNGAFMTNEEILRETEKFDPDFIGIYSTTFGWKRATKTADGLRTIFGKNVFICVGGPYPIAMQERCLEDAGEGFDAVVTGEGEFTCLEMVERLHSGNGLEGVQGVIYREGGRIIKNSPRPFITNLDSLPFPARELLGDPDLYLPSPGTYKRRPVAVVITSRGCNGRCIFCFQIDKERKSGIRYRSVENVMEEIEHCVRQGYKEIRFIDDTFAGDYDRAMQLAQEIKASKLNFTWFVSACVDQVDKSLLTAFKNAGCWAILFGAESGVQKNLNTVKKGIKLEQTWSAVKWAKEAGLKVSTPFMFGIPGETFEEGLQTIEFALTLDPDIANFHAVAPFPGTHLYDDVERYGTMSDELTDFSYEGAAFVPYTMTRDEISKLRQIAFRRFYSRPSFILKKLAQLRSLNDLKVAATGVRSLFWLWANNDLFTKRW
ncbi:MAG: radical SAM protein [Acidobacteria bacterium]|nr:radical SAM protein [Acidobacteriota bacterium]